MGQQVTATIIALGVILALALMIWGAVNAAMRDSNARRDALVREQAEIIKALTTREEIEDAINADADLVGRSVKWVRADPGK